MDDIADYVDKDGRLTQPIPECRMETEAHVFGVLCAMRRLLKPDVSPPNTRFVTYDLTTGPMDFLCGAAQTGALTWQDIRDILSRGIQLHEICEHCMDSSALGPLRTPIHAQLVDIMLFILELHDPARDRLRCSRISPDAVHTAAIDDFTMTCGANNSKTFKPNYDRSSKEQIVAHWAWEKKLRESKEFRKNMRYVLGRLRAEKDHVAPYWMFSAGTREGCGPTFLAFDASFRFDGDASTEVADFMRNESRDPSFAVDLGDADSGDDYIRAFCRDYSLEMVGTPFLSPPLDDELHVYAKKVIVSERRDSLAVTIPSFYRGNHLETLLDKDFHELNKFFHGKTVVRPRWPVKTPDTNTSPLTSDEMGAAAIVIKRVAERRCGMTKGEAFGCAENCLSFWWGTDTRSRIVKFIRPPAREKKSLKRILPRPELIRMIDDAVKHCDLTSEQRFAWARFMAALRRRKLI